MFEKPTAARVAGVEWEDRRIRVAILSVKSKEPLIEELFTFELPEQTHHPLKQSEEGRHLLNLTKECLIITGLASNDLLIRPLEIKLKKIRDLNALLPFQAEPLLPFPVEQAVLDSLPRETSPDGLLLTLIAARKDFVERHLDQWKLVDIDPEVVGAVPAALSAFGTHYSYQTEPYFHLHIGSSTTTGLLVEEGKLIAAQSASIGWKHIEDAYLLDRGDPSQIEDKLRKKNWNNLSETDWPHLSDVWRTLNRECTRLILALGKNHQGSIIDVIFFTGEGGYGTAAETIAKQLDKHYLAPLAEASTQTSSLDLQRMAIPIGFALTALPGMSEQINFRQKEFVYSHPWKRLRQPLLLYFILCSLLAGSLYLYGSAKQGARLDELRQQYVELLGAMQRDYPSLEAKARQRTSLAQGVVPSSPPPVKSLSANEIMDRLSILETELQATPETMALYPNLPRISDTLAWLQSLPQVVDRQGTDVKGFITLENFSYTLVKRPELTKRQEKYQGRVEFSFTSTSPRAARLFHDVLLAPNAFIDSQQEVKWTNDRSLYRVAFFLKDRTRYP